MDWEYFYQNELNAEGKFLVDFMVARLLAKYKKLQHAAPMGEKSAREIVLELLCRYWNGAIPKDFPMLVEVVK